MRLIFLSLAAALTHANVFLQSPRGSNNRLNERSAARKNPSRLFYSNNNDRGGYNVGDRTDTPFQNEQGQYAMRYFQSGRAAQTFLTVEWTNSLGCGVDEDGDRINNCQVVLQTLCQPDDTNGQPAQADSTTLRNGKTTDTQSYTIDPNDLPDPAGACFADDHTRDLSGRHVRIPRNQPEGSIQWCKSHCRQRGFAYAGVQFSFDCFCDNDFGKYGRADDCDKLCEDGSGDICGGTWRNNVYLATGPGLTCADDDATLVNGQCVEFSSNAIASENERGECNGVVKYGARGSFSYRTVDGSFRCNNALFGDPKRGVRKNCYCQTSSVAATAVVVQQEVETQEQKDARRSESTNADRGLHESWEYFDRCSDARKVSSQHGFECLSERQHWPAQEITPWTDVAVFVDDVSDCNDDILSSNEIEYFECVEFYDEEKTARRHKSAELSETECTAAGGSWIGFYKYHSLVPSVTEPRACDRMNRARNNDGFVYKWGRPMVWTDLAADVLTPEQCFTVPLKTHCHQTPNTRENYLGNVDGNGVDSVPETPRFQWAIPRYPDAQERRCVFRIRYILSNDEPEQITHSNNEFEVAGNTLALAVADRAAYENQVVFEDRSHVFVIAPRPAEIVDTQVLHNIVVRGKRGNIVQTFPAVEYDFVPSRLTIEQGDAVQIQWTGSNTHNNGGPAGDGQAGDAGEGRSGTDRHMFVQMADPKLNFPSPYENHTVFHNAEWLWASHEQGANEDNHGYNLALAYATGGYYHCKSEGECERSFESVSPKLQERFDNAPASYAGSVFVPSAGTYYYQCLRNNNFSNRSQKGRLVVTQNGQVVGAQTLRKRRATDDDKKDC